MVVDNLVLDHVELTQVVIVAVHLLIAGWVEGIILICNGSTFWLQQGLKKRQCLYVPSAESSLKLSIFISLYTNISSGCLLRALREQSDFIIPWDPKILCLVGMLKHS